MPFETEDRTDGIVIRKIVPADDAGVASIIRSVMTEFCCNREGFAIHDAEVSAMSAAYRGEDAEYYVVVEAGAVLGCGGFAKLAGTQADERTCELRKMYFRKELRGRGIGERLLRLLLERMAKAGYARCYLETTEQMLEARKLYERMGFTALGANLGATGHHGCDRYYLKDLDLGQYPSPA